MVLLYGVFMTCVASVEAAQRPTHTYKVRAERSAAAPILQVVPARTGLKGLARHA